MRSFERKLEGRSGVEGSTTKRIEHVTAAMPSVVFLIAAGGAIAGALTLKLMGRDKTANFVAQWAPTLLMLGLYNKIVKVMGSERHDGHAMHAH
ncbi:MAG: hypothetical protein KF773_24455 [Deltaproteobacteria bacterium]|nr:hypothetical protein [Deltaproteobacteria bacterium]MCW5804642.1 hypothetical protein [Deltaproteobacteria bacterium]